MSVQWNFYLISDRVKVFTRSQAPVLLDSVYLWFIDNVKIHYNIFFFNSEGERRWEGEKHKQTHQPSDVQEGKTVFLSNLPLDIEEDALKQEIESFGKVISALVCLDKLLERPKGTGFVKYQVSWFVFVFSFSAQNRSAD